MTKFSKIIEYLFYLLIFLLPIQTQWIWHYGTLGGGQSQYLTFGLYGTEILLALIIIMALALKIKKRKEENYLINFKLRDLYILFFLFFLTIALGIFWAIDRSITIYYLWKFFEGFLLLFLIINTKIDFFNTALAFVFSGLAQSILALYQFFTQQVFGTKWLGMAAQIPSVGGTCVVESDCFRWLRAYGTLPHPNVLGGFLAIAIIFLFILILLAKQKWQKIFLWICLPIILTGLFFTFSKSAFLALGVGIAFLSIFIFLSPGKKDKNILLEIFFVCFVTLGILAIIYKDPIMTRFYGETRLELQSVEDRSNYIQESKQLIEKDWLSGVGLGNYTLAEFDQSVTKQPSYIYQPVHNVFFLAAAELGIFGFLILILIVIEILRRIYNFRIDYNLSLMDVFSKFKNDNYNDYREKFYWFLTTTSTFFALLIIMIFDHYLWDLYFGIILWWLCLGLLLKQLANKSI